MQNSYSKPESIPPISVDICFRNSWHRLWPCFFSLFVIALVVLGLTLPITFFSRFILIYEPETIENFPLLYLAAQFLIFALVSAPIGLGSYYVYLIAARGQRPQVRDLFVPFQTFWNVVGISLLLTLILTIGFLLLFIPGIVLSCRLGFAPLLIVDKKMGVTEAIGYSWRMTRGHAWTVFFVFLLSIPILLVGVLCLIIGIIPATMWVYLAYATLYNLIVTQYSDTNTAVQTIQESRRSKSTDVTSYTLVDNSGARHTIGSNGVTLGRQNTCSIVVSDPSVSRLHARILVAKDSCWVRDEGSQSGTFVNQNQLIVQQQLHVGDQLQIGKATFRLERNKS